MDVVGKGGAVQKKRKKEESNRASSTVILSTLMRLSFPLYCIQKKRGGRGGRKREKKRRSTIALTLPLRLPPLTLKETRRSVTRKKPEKGSVRLRDSIVLLSSYGSLIDVGGEKGEGGGVQERRNKEGRERARLAVSITKWICLHPEHRSPQKKKREEGGKKKRGGEGNHRYQVDGCATARNFDFAREVLKEGGKGLEGGRKEKREGGKERDIHAAYIVAQGTPRGDG